MLSFDYQTGALVAGRYQVIGPLGLGGSGQVYRAYDKQREQQVALKIMHETDSSGVARQRFEREAALVQKFEHPHVVGVHDFGHTEAGLPYIVFSLLEGRSLKGEIKKGGPMEPQRAARLVLQVLDALEAAHGMGIIHRDIKPANIFLCKTGAEEHVEVLDFGLAKALFGEEEELLETLTRTGYRLGTPRYMSPEMARGQAVGAAGDLYSLGLVFAEMLTAEFVVEGNTQIGVLVAHSSEQPLPLDPVLVSGPFGSVIQRAVAKNLDVRYRTALQMRADLDAALQRLVFDESQDSLSLSDEMAPTMVVEAGHVAQRLMSEAMEAKMSGTVAMDQAAMERAERQGQAMERAPVSQTTAMDEPKVNPAAAPTLPMSRDVVPSLPPAPARSTRREREPRRAVWVVLFVVLAVTSAVVGYWLGT